MPEYLRYYIGEEKKSEEWQLWGKDFDIHYKIECLDGTVKV